jgi:hypothetical protein
MCLKYCKLIIIYEINLSSHITICALSRCILSILDRELEWFLKMVATIWKSLLWWGKTLQRDSLQSKQENDRRSQQWFDSHIHNGRESIHDIDKRRIYWTLPQLDRNSRTTCLSLWDSFWWEFISCWLEKCNNSQSIRKLCSRLGILS